MRAFRTLLARLLIVTVLPASAVVAVAGSASAMAPICAGYFSDPSHVSGSAICNTIWEYEVHVTCSDGTSFVSYPEGLGYTYFSCAGHGTIFNAQAWIWYNSARTAPVDVAFG